MNISLQTYKALNKVFMRLCLLRRWTSDISEDKYSELAKQAFNCIITFFIACEEERAGNTIDWKMFPKIVIYRAFAKAHVQFDISESTIAKICEMGNISMDDIRQTIKDIIEEETSEDFRESICEVMGTREFRIFMAATQIATYIELVENRYKFNQNYMQTFHEICYNLESYKDIQGVRILSNPNNPLYHMLLTISGLRNQGRWIAYARSVECSVFGHSLDTAILAYLMSIEEYPEDEERASLMFFNGLFHDIAEAWTKDMPSIIKNRVNGLREGTEKYEMYMIQKYMYSVLPEYIVSKLKAVMFEEDNNITIKKFIKGADYLSASSECLRNIVGGSRDGNFYKAIVDVQEAIEIEKVRVTPNAKDFHLYILNEVEGTRNSLIFY